MTAVPHWVVGPADTDAELARAAMTGDRTAFAGIYDRYADRLHDFCVGMLRDRDDAADCVQDVFCTAATRLPQLREPDKLRPWLYAVARNEALRRLRERRRETPSDEVPDIVSSEPGPEGLAARNELADLIAEAAGGLSDRDRAVLELAYRHGLNGPDLADALGVSHSTATKIVYRLRETIKNSLGALLVSRRLRTTGTGCPDLAAILDGWDGQFTVLMRKRIARHVETCATCDRERHQLVSPAALLGGAPIFIPAPAALRERTLDQIQLTPLRTTSADPQPDVDRTDRISGRRRRRMAVMAALFAGTVVAALGLTIAWQHQPDEHVVPADSTETATQPASATPSATPGNPVPEPPLAPTESTTPTATAPPEVLAPPVPSTTHDVPTPQLAEPNPPVSEPPAAPPPSEPIRPTPRTRDTSSPPTTTRPTGLFPVPTAGSPGPTRAVITPTRRANNPAPANPSRRSTGDSGSSR
ncbi:MAG: sigma-70 family RNA polymerase sigma factor [Mycobacterium sp.]